MILLSTHCNTKVLLLFRNNHNLKIPLIAMVSGSLTAPCILPHAILRTDNVHNCNCPVTLTLVHVSELEVTMLGQSPQLDEIAAYCL